MKKLFTTVMICASMSSYCQIPINGLVAYYSFNGNANDQSGNTLNGTVTNATLTSDRFSILNSAYLFDGTTSFISIPSVAQAANSARSICAWIKTNSILSNCAVATGSALVNGGTFNMTVGYSGQAGKLGVMGFFNDFYPSIGTSVNDDAWHFICVTYDGFNTLRTYVDGQLDNINTTLTYATLGQMNFIGKSNHAISPYYFTGSIDDVGFWNRALTPCEIIGLYSGPYAISASASSSVICSGQGITFLAQSASPNNYTWTPGNLTGAIVTVSPSASTVYTITGKNAANCITTSTLAIQVNQPPLISVNSGSICSGQIFTISPSGANSYTISGGTSTVNPTSSTNYSISGTSVEGCVTATMAICSVLVYSLPIISVNSGSICLGQSFTIVPSGANVYGITGGTFIVAPFSNTNYTVTGVSAEGCLAANPVISAVNVFQLPTILVASNSPVLCVGESASLSVNGANSYTWSTGSNLFSISVSPTISTLYTVSGTDTNGCENVSSFLQEVNECTGISTDEPSVVSKINVYPNPNTGKFNIDAPIGLNIVISNALGEIILENDLKAGSNEIDLSAFPKGIYLVQTSGFGKGNFLKIIKH